MCEVEFDANLYFMAVAAKSRGCWSPSLGEMATQKSLNRGMITNDIIGIQHSGWPRRRTHVVVCASGPARESRGARTLWQYGGENCLPTRHSLVTHQQIATNVRG